MGKKVAAKIPVYRIYNFFQIICIQKNSFVIYIIIRLALGLNMSLVNIFDLLSNYHQKKSQQQEIIPDENKIIEAEDNEFRAPPSKRQKCVSEDDNVPNKRDLTLAPQPQSQQQSSVITLSWLMERYGLHRHGGVIGTMRQKQFAAIMDFVKKHISQQHPPIVVVYGGTGKVAGLKHYLYKQFTDILKFQVISCDNIPQKEVALHEWLCQQTSNINDTTPQQQQSTKRFIILQNVPSNLYNRKWWNCILYYIHQLALHYKQPCVVFVTMSTKDMHLTKLIRRQQKLDIILLKSKKANTTPCSVPCFMQHIYDIELNDLALFFEKVVILDLHICFPNRFTFITSNQLQHAVFCQSTWRGIIHQLCFILSFSSPEKSALYLEKSKKPIRNTMDDHDIPTMDLPPVPVFYVKYLQPSWSKGLHLEKFYSILFNKGLQYMLQYNDWDFFKQVGYLNLPYDPLTQFGSKNLNTISLSRTATVLENISLHNVMMKKQSSHYSDYLAPSPHYNISETFWWQNMFAYYTSLQTKKRCHTFTYTWPKFVTYEASPSFILVPKEIETLPSSATLVYSRFINQTAWLDGNVGMVVHDT